MLTKATKQKERSKIGREKNLLGDLLLDLSPGKLYTIILIYYYDCFEMVNSGPVLWQQILSAVALSILSAVTEKQSTFFITKNHEITKLSVSMKESISFSSAQCYSCCLCVTIVA